MLGFKTGLNSARIGQGLQFGKLVLGQSKAVYLLVQSVSVANCRDHPFVTFFI